MNIIRAKSFTADRAWGALDIANMGGITTRLHWTDQPYRWHVNDGEEVFVVLDGTVDMHYREAGEEKVATLAVGDIFCRRRMRARRTSARRGADPRRGKGRQRLAAGKKKPAVSGLRIQRSQLPLRAMAILLSPAPNKIRVNVCFADGTSADVALRQHAA